MARKASSKPDSGSSQSTAVRGSANFPPEAILLSPQSNRWLTAETAEARKLGILIGRVPEYNQTLN